MKKDDLNKKQRYALDTMLSGSNVFLTGDAGTGKTTVIQTFIDEVEKAGKNVLVSATTGIAADNIGYGATTVQVIEESEQEKDGRKIVKEKIVRKKVGSFSQFPVKLIVKMAQEFEKVYMADVFATLDDADSEAGEDSEK